MQGVMKRRGQDRSIEKPRSSPEGSNEDDDQMYPSRKEAALRSQLSRHPTTRRHSLRFRMTSPSYHLVILKL